MQSEIRMLLDEALAMLGENEIPAFKGSYHSYNVERARKSGHGDFASNVAMILSKTSGIKPRELAEKICSVLPVSPLLDRIEIAGPGFINFFLAVDAYHSLPNKIREESSLYGTSNVGDKKKIMIEFVSANPTGPLHVGHGRGAAYGDSLARVLRAAGYDAHSEYYINDAGRQMDILALSVWLRYLELSGSKFEFPKAAYQGDYIYDIAATLRREGENKYFTQHDVLFELLPEDDDLILDTLIDRAQSILSDLFDEIHSIALKSLTDNIRKDLSEFGVQYQTWFSEKSLIDEKEIDLVIDDLKKNGFLYEKDEALWFCSTEFGDEKDRVVYRANGNHTYFAADIAYHRNKILRGYDKIINVWGADHHGYIKRVRASLEAFGYQKNVLTVLLVQFASLYRGKEKVQMSTRSGEFVTLRELREEVGCDAARFYYALRKPDQHMDFDIELAKSQSNDNPVYYVQYAHARISSVFRQLAEKEISFDLEAADHSLLIEKQEVDILQKLSTYPEIVESAARCYEPHQIAYYLRELATDFHTYYNAHPFISAKDHLRLARLSLIDSTRQVLENGLLLLGVSAPTRM